MKPPASGIGAAILIALGAWIYAPSVRGGWIWDDDAEIVRNSALREAAGLGRIWSGRAGVDYFPLKGTAQWLQWHLWGDSPAGYHVASLALHLLSALLLWRLLGRLGLGPFGAWLGGLVLAAHPVAVESVAWISEFKNTLSLPLLLLALLAWVGYDHRRDRRTYVLALLCFLLALLCKTSVVMLPLILLLHAWWRRGRIGRRDLLAALPFLLLALALGAVTIAFQRERAIAGADLHLGGLAARLGGAGVAAAFYFCRAIFPAAWTPIFPHWPVDPPSVPPFLPWAALAAVLAWLAVRSARRIAARTALAGAGFFLLNLVPVLGMIPMAYSRISLVADHLSYVSLVGMAALFGAAAQTLAGSRSGTRQRFVIAAATLIIVILSVSSRREAAFFRDETGFWTRALARNPRSWTAENNLARLLLIRGQSAEAETHLRSALRLDPGDAEAHFNLALILTASRRYEESLAEDAAALRLRPGFPEARRGLGNTLLQAGRPAEAVPELQAALRLRPGYAEAHADLGVALASLGRPAAGIEELETALRLQPASAETHNNLGVTLLRLGRAAEAEGEFRAALRINPAYSGARANLEAAERDLGK